MSATQSIDVSILVVSYNTRAMTLAALDSVVAQTKGISYELIVVDNDSSDGSADAIAAHPANPRLIRLNENIGFARANNVAARHARGDYILLLNPDTVVLNRAIDRLYAFAIANPHAGIWGGRTLFADGRLNPSSCWGRMTLWNLACRASGLTGLLPRFSLFNGEAMGGWQRDSVARVDIVSGCFLMLPRHLWNALGGFDPAFFMYGEEADLCLRARQFGARPAITPDATIIHHGGASEATRFGKMIKLMAAKSLLISRHFPPATRAIALALHAAWPLTRWIALAAAARISGKARYAEAAGVWHEIWFHRADWQHGFAPEREPKISAATRARTT